MSDSITRVLVLAEHDNVAIKSATLHAIGAASRLGRAVDVLVIGFNADGAADAAAHVSGVDRVVVVDSPSLARQTAENIAVNALAIVSSGYSHLVAAATEFGKSAMPRIAAKLDVAQISDVIEIVSPDTFVRPVYAGNAYVTLRNTDRLKVLTVRTTAFEAAGGGGQSAIEAVAAIEEAQRSRVIKRELMKSERPELVGSRIVVSGGRGVGSSENFKLLEALADKLNAALGASRAAVDAGYVPNDYQIGQTGKIVAPDLYIAVGISGAIQHLAGMQDSKVIVAINKDPEAPIFQLADYGLVGDLFDIVPKFTAELG